MLASVAAELGAGPLARNPTDFVGVGNIFHLIAVWQAAATTTPGRSGVSSALSPKGMIMRFSLARSPLRTNSK